MRFRRRLKIFIVNDDKMFTTIVTSYLRQKIDAEIIAFESAEECLSQMKRKPDLIFLDYELDGNSSEAMNGFNALLRIRAINPDQKIVMISEEDNIEILVKCLEFGASEVLVKTTMAQKKFEHIINEIIPMLNFRMPVIFD